MYMLRGSATARVSNATETLRGTWDMDQDGWKGVLEIERIWDARVEKAGDCSYPVFSISGAYTDADGNRYAVSGKLGGPDGNDRGEGCHRSDHRVCFTIAFPGNNQVFEGYVFSWTLSAMAGYTWWGGRPFGWYARKR